MSSKFFTPVEFVVPTDPSLPKPTKTVWNTEKLAQAEKEIKEEVESLKSGTSQYSVYAIDPGRFGFPAINALNKFIQSPNDRTLKSFEDSANSTFGTRAGKAFTDKLREAMEVVDVDK